MNDLFSVSNLELNVVASAVVVLFAVVMRLIGGRIIRAQSWASPEDARRWMVRLRNITLIVALAAMVVVWADELRAAAIAFLALGVAMVIATKELIVSVSGSLVRATSGSFAVGDRIRVGDVRGIVIDHSLLTTSLLEIGPSHVRTGRLVVLPNSVFVTTPVANETRGHEFVLHSFVVPVERSEWRRAERILRQAAVAEAAPYIDDARIQMTQRATRYAISVPTVEPFVLAKAVAKDAVELTVRLPVAASDLWQVEERIMRAWLEAPPEVPA